MKDLGLSLAATALLDELREVLKVWPHDRDEVDRLTEAYFDQTFFDQFGVPYQGPVRGVSA